MFATTSFVNLFYILARAPEKGSKHFTDGLRQISVKSDECKKLYINEPV